MARSRIFMDWRLVGLAAIMAVGAPGGAVMGDLPVAARVVLAVIGQSTWWYLFRCLKDTWNSRVTRRDADPVAEPGSGSGSAIIPWAIFTVTFYGHGLLLGHAWHRCLGQTTGYSLAEVLVSATLAALAATLTWGVIVRVMNGRNSGDTVRTERRSAFPAVLGALVVAVVLLWPAVAVWNGLADCAGTSGSGEAVLSWWPFWLPV